MCALVTGVQTCALPICSSVKPPWSRLNDFEVRRAAPSHGAKCWTRRTSKPASGCSVCFETCRDPIAPPTNTMVPLLSPHRDGAPNALPVGTIGLAFCTGCLSEEGRAARAWQYDGLARLIRKGLRTVYGKHKGSAGLRRRRTREKRGNRQSMRKGK